MRFVEGKRIAGNVPVALLSTVALLFFFSGNADAQSS